MRYLKIMNAAKSSAVLPPHKSTGKSNYQAVKKNERKYRPLKDHFEYLQNLGEVRGTRVVATLVNGMGGHVNHDNNIEVTYLPISMGYRNCYKRYMKALGYDVRTTSTGGYWLLQRRKERKQIPVSTLAFQRTTTCGSETIKT